MNRLARFFRKTEDPTALPTLRSDRKALFETREQLWSRVVSELRASQVGKSALQVDETTLERREALQEGDIEAQLGLPPTRYYITSAQETGNALIEAVQTALRPVFDPKDRRSPDPETEKVLLQGFDEAKRLEKAQDDDV